ncbi:MAG: DegV family protein [Anaerolineae bacterium]
MTGRVRVVTDSVSDLPPEVARRLGIAVVPIYFSLGGQSYRDDGTIDRRWFFDQLKRSDDLPQTAAPSIQDFVRTYKELQEDGVEEIVALFIDARLSSLVDHARRAAELVDGLSIHFVESGQVSMGLGWLAVEAAEAAAQGASVAEIRQRVAAARRRTFVLGALDSLDYLRRSGRVGWVKAQVGNFLRLKPLIGYHQGEARLLGRVRTHRRAVAWLVRWVEQAAPLRRLALLHTGLSPDVLRPLQERLASAASVPDVRVVEAGPVFTTHVGLDAVGVALLQTESAGEPDW